MKNTSRLMVVMAAALVAGLVFVPPGGFSAPRLPEKAPAFVAPAPEGGGGEIVLRIRDVKGLVKIIESMVENSQAARKGAVRDTIEQKFGGLDWLDEKRSTVLIGNIPDFSGTKAQGSFKLAGLVPFTKRNEKFRETFSAIEGKGYYLFTHPAGSVIKKAAIARLLAASKAKCPDMLAIEIPVSILASAFLEHGMPALEESLKKAQENSQGEKTEGKSELPTKKTLDMARAFYEFLRDVKTTEIGLNADDDKFSLRLSSVPVSGSALARAMAAARKEGGASLLAGYLPEGPITIRTTAFDYGPMMQILNNLYAKAGIDISCSMENSSWYTGEYALGVSFARAGVNLESMMILKKDGESVTSLVGKMLECAGRVQILPELEEAYKKPVRTADSTVAGRKATGFIIKVKDSKDVEVNLSIRAALSGRILVYAPDDERLAALLARADKMKPARSEGPLAQGRIDLVALINGADLMEGKKPGDSPDIEGSAPLNFSFDIKKGMAETLLWADMKEMRALFSQVQKAAKAKVLEDPEDSWSDIEEDDEDEGEGSHDGHGNGDGNLYGESEEEEAPAPANGLKPGADELDPKAAALLERGNLALVYGSPEQAISYFSRALKSAPESGQIHSALATACAEAKKFERALFHIEKALEIVPENPDYLYGRARIHLLSGDEARAMKDFSDAAAKGSDDAKRFLERMKEKP